MRVRDLCILLAFAMCAGPLAAQETTGKIDGRVVDAQSLAVPGATVTVTGPQGIKTATTDADGRFTLPFLTPGVYGIRAEIQGLKAFEQKSITVGLGQTVEIPVKLEVGGVTEIVNVTGSPSVIDTTSTTTGAVISSELLESIPTGRRVSDTLYLAPGVSSSGSAGSANPSISGGSGLDNLYVIDGVNVTNTGYGALGSYSIEFGSLGNSTPFDFVQEVQVKTGGYEAEYGQALGGVMNVVTKSGSNTIRGSLFGYTQPEKTEGTWTQYQSTNQTTVQTLGTRSYDGGVEGGGPIIKNKLFFYGAIDPTYNFSTLEAPVGQPLFSLGGVERERRNINYAAKATLQLDSANRIDASFFGDPSTGFNGPQRASALTVTDTSSYSSLTYGGHNQTVRYSGALSSKWLLEGTYARAVNNMAETPSVDSWRVTDRTALVPITTGGIGFFEGGNNSLDNQWSAKATNILGSHQLKYGVEYDHVDYTQATQYSGPTFVAPDGQMTATGATITILPDVSLGQIYRVTRATFNPSRATTQNYADFFVQDTWRVGGRLTINPGLRYEQEKQNGVLEQLTLNNNWAPRLGATYDATGDGKTKVYGSFGRFYARMPNDLAARALSVDNTISLADYYDAGLTRPIPNSVTTQVPGSSSVTTNHYIPGSASPDTIDPNIKMSYTTEYVLGLEREVLPNTTFGIRYIHRDLGRAIEDVQTAPYIPYINGDAGVTYNYFLTNPSTSTPVSPQVPGFDISFNDPVHTYKAVEVTLSRRLTNNWSALASYRWSRLRGNYEGFYDNLNGQSDPGITAVFDFPYNDPSYTALGAALGLPGDLRFLADPNGILALDQPQSLKLNANYSMHNGLNIGAAFNAGSGLPLTPLAYNVAYGEAGDIPTAPLGSGIQTVDGFKTRTPFLTQTDLQVSYAIKFAGTRHLTLLADVFNLFNQQTVIRYDTFTQLAAGTANPNFGEPVSQVVAGPQYQAPIQIRFGARLQF